MADGTITVAESTGGNKILDTESLAVGANTVQRERVQIAGTGAAQLANVTTNNDLQVSAVGRTVVSSTSFTRPANVTGYTAEDAVNNSDSAPVILTFSGIGRYNGGTGAIIQARLDTDQPDHATRFRLYLYDVSTITMNNDNVAFTDLYADSASLIGTFDFSGSSEDGIGTATAATHAARKQTTPNMIFDCAAGDTALYGRLVTLDGFTPISGQRFTITLWVQQD